MNIAIVGAKGTGKSALARALQIATQPADMPGGFMVAQSLQLAQAVSQDLLFQDTSLYPRALENHRSYGLTLVMGLDLPLVFPEVHAVKPLQQARFDARLRQVLDGHGVPYTVVYGCGQARTDCALQAIAHHHSRSQSRTHRAPQSGHTAWQWSCDTCSDAECEHRMFSALLKQASVRP